MRHNRALASIRAGGIALGMFSLEFASTGLARTVASAGADFVVFDQEHTGWTTETIASCSRLRARPTSRRSCVCRRPTPMASGSRSRSVRSA